MWSSIDAIWPLKALWIGTPQHFVATHCTPPTAPIGVFVVLNTLENKLRTLSRVTLAVH